MKGVERVFCLFNNYGEDRVDQSICEVMSIYGLRVQTVCKQFQDLGEYCYFGCKQFDSSTIKEDVPFGIE